MIDLDMILGVRTRVVWKKFSEGSGESSLKFSGITSESSCGKLWDKEKKIGQIEQNGQIMTNKNDKVEDSIPWERGGRRNMSC